jgi:oligopeptide transport system permease protein
MERCAEILSGVPFIVVATLFNLHLQEKVGPLVSLLFAFVLTGWLGMAGRVRMQFYRFKGQEYILSSRTLGASDLRIMFKHIFPNAIGTIITGSILSIPGVIFSESSLSYLRIIDLETSGFTSVGTLLSNGSGFVNTYPHILVPPVVFISLLMISFNLFGNGLRDALNPSLRGADE